MKSPYGLDILDNCTTCSVREQHLFCNLSPSAVQRLNDITSPAIYPPAAMLFIEGQQGRGLLSFAQARQSCPPLREKARPLSLNRGARRPAGTECDHFQSSL